MGTVYICRLPETRQGLDHGIKSAGVDADPSPRRRGGQRGVTSIIRLTIKLYHVVSTRYWCGASQVQFSLDNFSRTINIITRALAIHRTTQHALDIQIIRHHEDSRKTALLDATALCLCVFFSKTSGQTVLILLWVPRISESGKYHSGVCSWATFYSFTIFPTEPKLGHRRPSTFYTVHRSYWVTLETGTTGSSLYTGLYHLRLRVTFRCGPIGSSVSTTG